MRIAYGYNRSEKDFAHLTVDRVWLDVKSSQRRERAEMFAGGLRQGDTLVLLDRKDIGRERGLLSKAEGLGVTIEAHDPKKAPAPRGRPRTFNPNPTQDKKIKDWFKAAYELRYVIRRASEEMGHPVNRGQLYHRYGNRWMK